MGFRSGTCRCRSSDWPTSTPRDARHPAQDRCTGAGATAIAPGDRLLHDRWGSARCATGAGAAGRPGHTAPGELVEFGSSHAESALPVVPSDRRDLPGGGRFTARRAPAAGRVVPNGTPEPAHWSPLQDRTGPLTYVVASRWNGWKGHRTLLAAWDRASSDAAPGTLLVLGGPPPSGDAVGVAGLVAGLKHPDSVRIVGETPDASPDLDDADVVMPSDQPEPLGLVASEAFARRRPVAASAAGRVLDIVTDRQDRLAVLATGRRCARPAPQRAGSCQSRQSRRRSPPDLRGRLHHRAIRQPMARSSPERPTATHSCGALG